MGTEHDAILITGATGLVGGLLLLRLAEEYPERTIYSLVRRCTASASPPNTHPIPGDITRPGLGLSSDLYSLLSRTVGTIVHCAASTKFNLPLAASREVNVHGTANIVELARRSPRLRLLVHVSSTYVAGRKAGPLREGPLTEPEGWFSSYEQSKFEAERFVCDHASGIPWVIARLSTIVGNSRTGHVSCPNYFHRLLRLVRHNPFPLIPGDPNSLVDFIADDFATDGLVEIVRGKVSPGTFFHLCAGREQSLSAYELVELAFRLHRQRHVASRPVAPSFVSFEQFKALAAGFEKRGEATLWRMSELLLLCLPHLAVDQYFLDAQTRVFLERRGVTAPVLRDFLPRVIESCV